MANKIFIKNNFDVSPQKNIMKNAKNLVVVMYASQTYIPLFYNKFHLSLSCFLHPRSMHQDTQSKSKPLDKSHL